MKKQFRQCLPNTNQARVPADIFDTILKFLESVQDFL